MRKSPRRSSRTPPRDTWTPLLLLFVGLHLFHDGDGREKLLDVGRQVRAACRVLGDRRQLTTALPLHEFGRQDLQWIACLALGFSMVISFEQPGHLREDNPQALQGPDVANAGGLLLNAQHFGDLAIAQFLEMPQRQDLAVQRVHGRDDLFHLFERFRAGCRLAGRGHVAHQLRRQ